MSLLCLTFLGFLIGWLVAIVTRTEESRAIRRDIGTGIVGALVTGLVANNGAFLGGLSWIALGVSVFGALTLVTIRKFVLRRRSV